MDNLKKFGPIAVAALGLLTPILSPMIAQFWANHGTAAIIVGSLTTALAAFAPQPHK